MYLDGNQAIQIMRVVQRLKRKFIAKTLSDIEEEFQHADTVTNRVRTLRHEAEAKGAVNSDMLMRVLTDLDNQMPDYQVVRKIVLDNFNEYSRNIFQALLGDVEGYGSTSNRHRHR